jgi:mRNA interferase RelE/StbE
MNGPVGLRYHPAVRDEDLPRIDARQRAMLARAIAHRLGGGPARCGEPLRRTLKGYWKLRVGDWRIVFKPAGKEIWIFAVIDRRDVYEIVSSRLGWHG